MESKGTVPEDPSKLVAFEGGGKPVTPGQVVGALRQDHVVLVRGLNAPQADALMHSTADSLGLGEALELQATFASVMGHREALGSYYMTVNKRDDYHFIPPHSEGHRVAGMQLASFYCYENTTDGGDTILLNLNPACEGWSSLREMVTRAKVTRQLAQSEIAQARGMYGINVPRDLLKDSDSVVAERPTSIPGLTLVDVLVPLEKIHSVLLDRDVYAYWDTVASLDLDAAPQYERLLRESGLLKEPPGGLELRQLDNAADRRIYSSKVEFASLFASRLTYKLKAGDFVIVNNLTWAHSVSNWTPGSGTRKVSAAFA
ncbi:MAG: hypothetical protein SFX73_00275 [Kofleriaceae bacterium]|nr:hypothetical protein [Kofleriaceae bacterium]